MPTNVKKRSRKTLPWAKCASHISNICDFDATMLKMTCFLLFEIKKKNLKHQKCAWKCKKSFAVFFSRTHTENASRFCYANGTWDNYANYDQCDQIDLTYGIETLPHLERITHIWTAGYTLSLVSLILGIAIFIHFKWVFFNWFVKFIIMHLKRRDTNEFNNVTVDTRIQTQDSSECQVSQCFICSLSHCEIYCFFTLGNIFQVVSGTRTILALDIQVKV